MDRLISMINRELVLQKDYLGKGTTVKTIYFGGGTPSLLSVFQLESILSTIDQHFLTELEEITIETNPDDLSTAKLADLKSLGFDRLSIGIQSFNEGILQACNRAHTASESLEALKKARNAGFSRLSIDLMYGFPHADHSIWKNDLDTAIHQQPDHISSYGLTIEKKTAFGKWVSQGRMVPADEEYMATQFEIMQEKLGRAGYIQYEISNFGKPGKFALHNSNYWKSVPYLGIGPSAHSFNGISRQFNVASNAKYIQALEQELIPFTLETLEGMDRLNEYILTSLRTIWGVDLGWIQSEFQKDLLKQKGKILSKLQEDGLILIEYGKISLTAKGKLLADSISASLFL